MCERFKSCPDAPIDMKLSAITELTQVAPCLW